MAEEDYNWAKMSRHQKPTIQRMILDALNDNEKIGNSMEQTSLGMPMEPSLPLFGSLNVPISQREEDEDE